MRATLFSGSFLSNLAAYGASEVAAKASRLLVVVSVARFMDAGEIGVAAAAIAAGDILKALTENGVGQRIIAARDEDLAATCATARRIFWAWCLGLFAVQIAIGGAMYAAGSDPVFFALMALLAAEYLFMPAGLVQAALAMRAGKLRQTAAIAGGQVAGANVMTAVLVIVWPSALALILPRLLAAPIWLVAMRRLHPWQSDGTRPAPLRPFVRFGAGVLGVEVVRALQLQADKLVVGWMLGAEALGLYFLAFNAGLGLATSFSTAFSRVVYPHLCTACDPAQALRQSIVLGTGLIAPIVIAQSLLAPVYVPLLLGDGWTEAPAIVSILCLAAIPGVLWSAAAGRLRAQGRSGVEFQLTFLLTAALIANTALLAPYGLTAIAWGYLIVATALQLAASWPALCLILPITRKA